MTGETEKKTSTHQGEKVSRNQSFYNRIVPKDLNRDGFLLESLLVVLALVSRAGSWRHVSFSSVTYHSLAYTKPANSVFRAL